MGFCSGQRPDSHYCHRMSGSASPVFAVSVVTDHREDAFHNVLGAGRGAPTQKVDAATLDALVNATIERWQCTGAVLSVLGLQQTPTRVHREIPRVFAHLAAACLQPSDEQCLDELYVLAIARVAGTRAAANPTPVLPRALSAECYQGLFKGRGARFARLKDARAAAAELSADDWTRVYEQAMRAADVARYPDFMMSCDLLTKNLDDRLPVALTIANR